MSCNFGLESYLWFQIELARILKSRVWFQNKLHSTQFNYHYISVKGVMWRGFCCLTLFTPKIWLVILLSGCYTFHCALVQRIWVCIKSASSGYYISLFLSPFCWTMNWYYKEKLDADHFWELKGWRQFCAEVIT